MPLVEIVIYGLAGGFLMYFVQFLHPEDE